MRDKYKYLLLFCALLSLHACAMTPTKEVDNTIIANSSEGNSTVYFIDDSSYWLGFMYKEGKGGVKIFINDLYLDQLEQNGFKRVYIKPNSYVFSIFPGNLRKSPDLKSGTINLVVEEDKTYYILGGFDGAKQWAEPFAGSPYKLIQIPAAKANALMSNDKN